MNELLKYLKELRGKEELDKEMVVYINISVNQLEELIEAMKLYDLLDSVKKKQSNIKTIPISEVK